jgi:hypothetical protein
MRYKAKPSKKHPKLKNDPVLKTMKNRQDVSDWIDLNIEDLEDVRNYLKRLTSALIQQNKEK